MDTTKELFDLTPKELEIYKFLLKNPGKNAVEISVDIKMQRPNVYDLLNNLLTKGLVSFNLNGKVKIYSATSPKKLKDIYEFKKSELILKENEANKIVENLLALTSSTNSDLDIRTYVGLKGMRTVLMEALEETHKTKKEMIVIRLNKEDLPKLDKTYTERFFNFRRKYGIKSRYLMLKETKFYEDELVQRKNLPDKYESKVGIYIYGNCVSFWFFPQKEMILVIENKELADTFRNNFEVIWNNSSK